MINGKSPSRSPSVPNVIVTVLRIDPGRSAIFRTLSSSYKGCFVHHTNGRGQYCPGADACQFHRVPSQWKGYCCVEEWSQAGNLWEPRVLEISEALDQDFYSLFNRAQVWEITKAAREKGSKKNPALRGKFLEQRPENTIPAAFDMRSPLAILYHCAEVRLCHENPVPRRLTMQASQGDGPAHLPTARTETVPIRPEHRDRLREYGAAEVGPLSDQVRRIAGLNGVGHMPQNTKD